MQNLNTEPQATGSVEGGPKEEPKRIRRFNTAQEAKAYLYDSLDLKGLKIPKSEDLPWNQKKEDAPAKLVPRNNFELSMKYLASYELGKQIKQSVGELAPIVFHEGYFVRDDAPEEIQKLAKDLRESSARLPMDIAIFTHVLNEIQSGAHELQREIAAAEAAGDFTLAQIRTTELQTLKDHVEERLESLKDAVLVVQNKERWDERLKDKAGLYKRAWELREKMEASVEARKNTKQTILSEEEFIQSVEDGRELKALMDSKLFGMGNPTLELYVYQHPEVTADHRFEAVREDDQARDPAEPEMKTLEEGLTREKFKEVKPVWPRTPLFDGMEPNSFKLLAYSEEEIRQDVSKKGYVHTILYKSADGKTYEKPLEATANGWTDFAANSLIKALTKMEEVDVALSPQVLRARDLKALENGFGLDDLSVESRKAIFANLVPGTFKMLIWPAGDIDGDPEKEGCVHSILYKTSSGECLRKSLRTGGSISSMHDPGWYTLEAQALIQELEKLP